MSNNLVNRKEIARRTGVSMTVISHVLTNAPNARVKAETREKVLQVAKELGYVTNALGKALIENRIYHIGLAINCTAPDDDLFCKRVIGGATAAAAEHGYHILLYPLKSRMDENLAGDLAKLVQSKRVDGLIINKEDVLTSEVAKLVRLNLPLVLINNHFTLPIPDSDMIDSFCPDLFFGVRIAANHLISRGHRRIALFRSENGVFPKENHRGSDYKRENGYIEALKNMDIRPDPNLIAVGDFARTEDIERAAGILASLSEPPTAVIAATDSIAHKARWFLKKYGVSIEPDAVVGGGNLAFREFLDRPFRSLILPLEQMARLAVERLLLRIDADSPLPGVMTILPVTMTSS